MNHRKPLSSESLWPHRWAVLLCCATFPLIWVGGLVTTYDAGMAVPDWPSTYGYNLLAYPPVTWFFGPWDLFIEHGHRLLGVVVGLLAIAFAISVFVGDSRSWVRALSVAALTLVIVQGVLGGARVLMDERQLAMVHGCLGPAFFGFSVVLAVCTSRFWHDAECDHAVGTRKLHRLAFMTMSIAYLQLVLGAQLRHIPITASPATFRIAVVFHLLTALILAGHVFALTRHVFCHARRHRALVRPVLLLTGLVCCQFLLGPASWVVKYGWPQWLAELPLTAAYTIQANGMFQSMIVTSHVALGSLIIAVAVLVFVRSLRLFRSRTVAISSSALFVGMTA